jgi:hypothetical protein
MNFGNTFRNIGNTLGNAAQSTGRFLGNTAQSAAQQAGRFANNTLVPGIQRFGQGLAQAAPSMISGIAPLAGSAIGGALGGPAGAGIGAQLAGGLGSAVNSIMGMPHADQTNIGNAVGGAVNGALPQNMQGMTFGQMGQNAMQGAQGAIDRYLPGMGGMMTGMAGQYLNNRFGGMIPQGMSNMTPGQATSQGINNAFSSFAPPTGYAAGGQVGYPSLMAMFN